MARPKSHLTLFLLSAAWLLPSSEAFAEQRFARITSGAVITSGWQNGLIRHNPNLRHFTWVPIVSYTQKMAPVMPPGPPKFPLGAPPSRKTHGRGNRDFGQKKSTSTAFNKSQPITYNWAPIEPRAPIYIKPRHVSTPVRQSNNDSQRFTYAPLEPRRPIYIKPVALPVMQRATESNNKNPYRHVAAQRRRETVGGRLASRDVAGSPSSEQLQGQLGRRNALGNLSNREVYGSLSTKKVAGVLCQSPEGIRANADCLKHPEVLVYPETYVSLQSNDCAGALNSSSSNKTVYGRLMPVKDRYRHF